MKKKSILLVSVLFTCFMLIGCGLKVKDETEKMCSISECENEIYKDSLCQKHYTRAQKEDGGDVPEPTATSTPYPTTSVEAFEYHEMMDSGIKITKYIGSEEYVGIPSEIEGRKVTSIGDRAFYDCDSLTSITIPDSVTSIGEDAFACCTSLSSITIPDSVTSIRGYSFLECSSLTSIIIPDSVTSIGEFAFYDCDSLTSITIPDSVTSIGTGAFRGCSSLSSIEVSKKNPVFDSRNNCNAIIEKETNELIAGCKNTIIPDSVTSIGEDAFWECSSLTSITIPDSVTSIGEDAFWECSSLSSIEVSKKNPVYDSRNNCNAIIEKATNELIAGCKNTIIPDSVTSIGWYAFDGCDSLTSITIPDSVTSIGGYAFDGCDSLTSITIPDSVTSIGKDAFSGCSSLSSIEVSKKNPVYDSRNNCNAIIEKETNELIAGCKNTIIPDSVTSIGGYAFDGCDSLTSITIPDSVTSIGTRAFLECSSLTSITIPDSVTSIGDYAFESCRSLSSITIPDSVTSIGDYAFESCRSLSSITIPDSVTSIGTRAFLECSSLTSITIPDSVTSIGDWAFSGCDSLTSIYCSKTSPVWKKLVSDYYESIMKEK